MAKTTATESRSRRQSVGIENFPGLDPAQFTANLEPLFQAGNRMLESWRVVSEELMEFSKSRLTRNIEVGRKVARCSSIDEAMEAQADYARATMQDYLAESSKLAELSTRALFDSLSAWHTEKKASSRAPGAAEAETTESHSEERVAAE